MAKEGTPRGAAIDKSDELQGQALNRSVSAARNSTQTSIVDLLASIAKRDPARSEATLQADIRQLILTAPLSLSDEHLKIVDMETPVGFRRRIDIEAGGCLIEVKRELSTGNVFADATESSWPITSQPGRTRPAAGTSASLPTGTTGDA